MFPAMIEKKELKTSCFSLQDTGVFCSPVFDEYADGVEKISISTDVDLSSQPIYESYIEEPLSFLIKKQPHVQINHSMFVEYIEHDGFNLAANFRCSCQFAAPHKQKIEIFHEEDINQERVSSEISPLLFPELQKPIYKKIHTLEIEEILEQQAEVTLFGCQTISSFYDPMSIYMESYFSEDFSLSIFRMKADDDCEYMLQIQILLQVMNSPLILVCIERAFVTSLMLAWLHWKHDVT
jgi:hypothetical protein